MLYVIFSRYGSDSDFAVHYAGKSKTSAINSFKTEVGSAFSITARLGKIYFVGFDTATAVGNLLKDKKQADYTAKEMSTIMQNLDRAACVSCCYTTKPLSAITKTESKVPACSECGKTGSTVYKSAYDKLYCESCWNAYIQSEAGLVEYAIGIADGVYNTSTFVTAELNAIASSWIQNRDLLCIEEIDKLRIEQACKKAGLALKA